MKKNIWDDPRTKLAQALAYEGFTHMTICNYAELAPGQLQYRLGKIGVSTGEVRRGETDEARERIARIVKQCRPERRAAAKQQRRK